MVRRGLDLCVFVLWLGVGFEGLSWKKLYSAMGPPIPLIPTYSYWPI